MGRLSLMSVPVRENAPLITMHRIDAGTIHLPPKQSCNTLRASSNIMDGNTFLIDVS